MPQQPHPQPNLSRRVLLGAAAVAALSAGGITTGLLRKDDDSSPPSATPETGKPLTLSTNPDDYHFERLSAPGRTVVRDGQGTLAATFTDDARTVTVTGPERIFDEPDSTTASVTHSTWVRLLPQAWKAGQEQDAATRKWLVDRIHDRSADVLAVSMEYIRSAPVKKNVDGLRIAGDASFGPERNDGGGLRSEASDFYDYLGVPWTFKDGVNERPSANRYGAVDCSGYLRLVYGYRLGFPLLGRNVRGEGLPRRAYAMAGLGPGTLLIPDTGVQPTDVGLLLPGDLVFFATDNQPPLDHSGIYLGLDSDEKHRFISSRGGPDGPTMGDQSGASVLDGRGLFTRGFRTARRI